MLIDLNWFWGVGLSSVGPEPSVRQFVQKAHGCPSYMTGYIPYLAAKNGMEELVESQNTP